MFGDLLFKKPMNVLMAFIPQVSTIQTINSVIVSCAVALLLLLYYKNNNYYYLGIATKSVFVHCFTDLFLTRSKDIFFHHICVILFVTYKFLNNIQYQDDYFITISLLNTELSTFFYVFKLYMDDNNPCNNMRLSHVNNELDKNELIKANNSIIFNTVYQINDLLFLLTFMKLRVFDLFVNIIRNNNVHNLVFNVSGYNILSNLHVYIGLYGLYLLNLYWFAIIMKKMYKYTVIKYFPNINSELISLKMQSYTYFYNLMQSIYIYSFYPNEVYIYDVFGIIALSMNSFTFHNSKYLILKNNPDDVIEYTSKDVNKNYLNDVISIHLRSFCCVITNSIHLPYGNFVIIISGLFHVFGFYGFLDYILDLYRNNTRFYNDKTIESKSHLQITNFLTSFPSLVDTCIVMFNTNNSELRSVLFVITCCLGLILYIEPFYELNHLLFHIFLILQTLYLCKCNVFVNNNISL